MIIASATIELEIPSSVSLKDKRRVVKSVLARLRREFNLAAAEVDALDEWQRAIIAIVTISNDAGYAHGLLEKTISSLAESRLDCNLASYHIEML